MSELLVVSVVVLCASITGYAIAWFMYWQDEKQRRRDRTFQREAYSAYADAARTVANLPEGPFKEGAFQALAEMRKNDE